MSIEKSPVTLLEGASGQRIAAELWDAITDQQLADWDEHWVPALQSVLARMRDAGVVRSLFPQSRHWNWRDKAAAFDGSLANPSFCVVCQGMTQGLMILDTLHKARLPQQKDKELIYVEYLENAPWNRQHLPGDVVRFAGVGSVLVRAAVEVSLAEGFKGRLGLHSLPQSDAFYAKIGMTDMGVDTNYQSGRMRYFEMTTEQAAAFISGRTKP